MAISATYPAKLAVGSLYAASANQIKIGDVVNMNDASTFGTAPFAAFTAGLRTVVLTVDGFHDNSTLLPDSSLERTRSMGIVPVSCSPTGAVASAYAVMTVGVLASSTRADSKAGANNAMALTFQPTGVPLVEGFVSDAGTTDRTATYTGAIAQLGAVAAGKKIYANVHVLDTTGSGGTPSITPRLESDNAVGFGSPTTVVTGTAMTPAVGEGASQTLSASGAIADDYFRLQVTISGVTPHLLIFAVIGIR